MRPDIQYSCALFNPKLHPVIKLTEEERARLSIHFQQMQQLLASDYPFKWEMIRSLLLATVAVASVSTPAYAQISAYCGKFSEATFRQALQQRGISEKLVRMDLEQGLVARQILVPAAFGAVVPRELATRYATLLREHRTGAIAILPSAAFAPATPPTEAELSAFYAKSKDRFIRPERRVVRYATFGEESLKTVPAPTEDQIAARYNAAKAQYSASETRKITQMIVPTEAGIQQRISNAVSAARDSSKSASPDGAETLASPHSSASLPDSSLPV